MKLIFDIIKSGKDFPLKRNFHFNMTNGTIGRSEEASWQLTDRQNYISSNHVSIEYKDGMYFIKDTSTNGTFLKYPYKKLPREMTIKINSTDIFIIGDYEIQARFSDNDYNQEDIISSKSSNILTQNTSNSTIQQTSQLIPDDDFLLEDNEIMNSSFVIPEEENFDNNVMSMFKEDEVSSDFDDIENYTKAEPTIIEEDFISDTVSFDPLQEHLNIPKFKDEIIEEEIVETIEEEIIVEKQSNSQTPKVILDDNEVLNSINILEKKLGIELSSLSQEQREAVVTEIANIVINSLDGLKSSLDIKDKIKKDLAISNVNPEYNDANPIKMGQYSLNLLDYKNNVNGIKLSEAIKKSFNELNIHNIALHRSSKNLINIAVSKFSPKSLEHHFDTNGELSALMPKKYQMWDAYINMFKKLNEDPDFGVNLIAKDFSNEYNNISYTIKLTSI